MQAGTSYIEHHNQVAGVVYRNICADYGLEVPKTKWDTPSKIMKNYRAKILWDFQIQTDEQVMVLVVVNKLQTNCYLSF